MCIYFKIKKRPIVGVFVLEACRRNVRIAHWATVAERNLTHCSQWFAVWQHSTRHVQTFARMRTGAGSPLTKFQNENAHNGAFLFWRPGSESNRHRRICSPLHNHSATRPEPVMPYYAKKNCNSIEKLYNYKEILYERENL